VPGAAEGISQGHDISAGDTPLEAGLGFAVSWDKPVAFKGRDSLLRLRERGLRRRLAQFALDDPTAVLHHEEPIFRDGELVGRIASAAYGQTLGRSVGLGYVTAPEAGLPRSWFEIGRYEIELANRRYSARASLQPMYDPKSERPKS
jgi:glycine cleavage system aminomethyltransferase T